MNIWFINLKCSYIFIYLFNTLKDLNFRSITNSGHYGEFFYFYLSIYFILKAYPLIYHLDTEICCNQFFVLKIFIKDCKLY